MLAELSSARTNSTATETGCATAGGIAAKSSNKPRAAMPRHDASVIAAKTPSMNKRIFFGFLASLCLTPTGAHASDIVVTDARARASLTPGATTAAIYLAITNASALDDTLLAITSDRAPIAMLHESKTVDGIMKMRHLESLDITAGTKVVLDPGNLHVMLMGLTSPLKEGETMTMTLTFAKAGQMIVTVPVVKDVGSAE